jgi:hypothetical protein
MYPIPAKEEVSNQGKCPYFVIVTRIIAPPKRTPNKILNRVFLTLQKKQDLSVINKSRNDKIDKIYKDNFIRKKPKNNIIKSGKK